MTFCQAFLGGFLLSSFLAFSSPPIFYDHHKISLGLVSENSEEGDPLAQVDFIFEPPGHELRKVELKLPVCLGPEFSQENRECYIVPFHKLIRGIEEFFIKECKEAYEKENQIIEKEEEEDIFHFSKKIAYSVTHMFFRGLFSREIVRELIARLPRVSGLSRVFTENLTAFNYFRTRVCSEIGQRWLALEVVRQAGKLGKPKEEGEKIEWLPLDYSDELTEGDVQSLRDFFGGKFEELFGLGSGEKVVCRQSFLQEKED